MSTREFKVVGKRLNRPDGADKVTGQARYGADYNLPGQLVGKILRSEVAHARIKSIDKTKAENLCGVFAVITGEDFPELGEVLIPAGKTILMNLRDISHHCMARDKVLFHGHPVAAVAATSKSVAEKAMDLIDVEYEVLPHVIDVEDAMLASAPVLHDTLCTQGAEPGSPKPSNIATIQELLKGDPDHTWGAMDVVLEDEFRTEAVHQGYIEPNAVLASANADGVVDVWCCTQGQFTVRAYCAAILEMDRSQIRVFPTEIGGGFGGKTSVYDEPVAIRLSQISGRPVKIVMTREEVFRATGPAPATVARVKIGATIDGRIRAAEYEVKMQAGAYPGGPIGSSSMAAFGAYDIDNIRTIAYDVVSNRPKVLAYRAPGAQTAAWAVESMIDALAQKLTMDPITLRLKNAARTGTKTLYGAELPEVGSLETLRAVQACKHYASPINPGYSRGVAFGFWFNVGMEASVGLHLAEDGSLTLALGSPDIGGTRASLAMMAAEELGVPYESVKPVILDSASIGYNHNTSGSRVTFATGMAVVEAARKMIKELRKRAAILWQSDLDSVAWIAGKAIQSGTSSSDKKSISISGLAEIAAETGGPINGHAQLYAEGVGPSFGCHIVDLMVDKNTGHVHIDRYTAVQDAGCAIHPSYVEGQMQGGVVQGIGWALNEAYIYNSDGKLENASFLDYRMPVASDVPSIETIIVEVPNPRHPYGVRGVGENPIIPPMPAIGNAICRNIGVRVNRLPMSPPALHAAIVERVGPEEGGD